MAEWYVKYPHMHCTHSVPQIIHLERDTCYNTDDIELNKLATECRYWPEFVDGYYLDAMLDGIDLEGYYGNLGVYMCPSKKKYFTKTIKI